MPSKCRFTTPDWWMARSLSVVPPCRCLHFSVICAQAHKNQALSLLQDSEATLSRAALDSRVTASLRFSFETFLITFNFLTSISFQMRVVHLRCFEPSELWAVRLVKFFHLDYRSSKYFLRSWSRWGVDSTMRRIRLIVPLSSQVLTFRCDYVERDLRVGCRRFCFAKQAFADL